MKGSQRIFAFGAVATVLFVAGCAPAVNPEKAISGKWEGTIKLAASEKDNPMAKMAEGMLEAFGGSKLELKQDKTFTMNMMFIPIEGSWKLVAKQVRLTPTKVMGLTVDEAKKLAEKGSGPKPKGDLSEPMVLTVSDDYKTLTMKGTNKDGDMVFERPAADTKA